MQQLSDCLDRGANMHGLGRRFFWLRVLDGAPHDNENQWKVRLYRVILNVIKSLSGSAVSIYEGPFVSVCLVES